MNVTVAKTAGFCFGVRRALELTEESAAKQPTCTLGELIHNRQVVQELARQGVPVIETPEDAPAGIAVVLRSHGVPPAVYDTLQRQGNPIVDATCPFVERLHTIAAEVPPHGVLLLAGQRLHPEVQGILGYCRGRAFPFSTQEELAEILKKRIFSVKYPSFWRLRPLFLCMNGRKSFFSQKKCVQI